MLRLLNDLRNHPAIVMMDHGVPITISPDDPIIYGYNGIRLLLKHALIG
jgi:adenosine deaminase